jgi:hypothetical protein
MSGSDRALNYKKKRKEFSARLEDSVVMDCHILRPVGPERFVG